MSDRWFDDLPEHDPNDPEAVERALRRQERAAQRQGDSRGSRSPAPSSGRTSRGSRDFGRRDSGRRDRSPSRRGSGGKKGGRRIGAIVVAAVAAGFLLFIAWFGISLWQPFKSEGSGEQFALNVPAGDSVRQIGDLLVENDVIPNAMMFEIRATLAGKRGDMTHGLHQVRKDMSYAAAIEELTRTTVKRTKMVVVPEGLSRPETARAVKAAGVPGDYMKASTGMPGFNPNKYGAQGRAKNLEGFLFPATYELRPNADAEELVGEQLKAFTNNIAGVNMKYAKSKNLTVYDVLTVASMIEREVSVPKERRTVAAVIYNRLKMGEPLHIDATVRFAVDNWATPLTQSELEVDSPYNTKINAGLPPGPIGNPGIESIKAAANPEKTDVWLYVVEPGTCGEHVFSSSLEEHNENVRKYQEAQEAAGGSPTQC